MTDNRDPLHVEVEQLRAEVERLRDAWALSEQQHDETYDEMSRRAEAAEAREAALRARIEALADDMDERGKPDANDSALDAQSRRQIREDVKRLRALASPAEGATPEPTPAAEAREAALRARIEALADARGRRCGVCTGSSPHWDGHDKNPACEQAAWDALRAALASPAEDTTPTEQQAQGGGYYFDPGPQTHWVNGGRHNKPLSKCVECSPVPVADPSGDHA